MNYLLKLVYTILFVVIAWSATIYFGTILVDQLVILSLKL